MNIHSLPLETGSPDWRLYHRVCCYDEDAIDHHFWRTKSGNIPHYRKLNDRLSWTHRTPSVTDLLAIRRCICIVNFNVNCLRQYILTPPSNYHLWNVIPSAVIHTHIVYCTARHRLWRATPTFSGTYGRYWVYSTEKVWEHTAAIGCKGLTKHPFLDASYHPNLDGVTKHPLLGDSYFSYTIQDLLNCMRLSCLKWLPLGTGPSVLYVNGYS